MATNFLWAAGTSNNGLIASTLTLMTTELNSGSMTAGAYVVSSVNGTSGVFSNSNTGQSMVGVPVLTFGGTWAPSGNLSVPCWFLVSLDGSTFEPASSHVARDPDFVFAFTSGATYASSEIVVAQGARVIPPAVKWKLLALNNGNATFPTSGNTITMGLTAPQY